MSWTNRLVQLWSQLQALLLTSCLAVFCLCENVFATGVSYVRYCQCLATHVAIFICVLVSQIKWHETIINLQLQPFAVLLKHTLEQLQAKDPTGIFAFPVPVSEVCILILGQKSLSLGHFQASLVFRIMGHLVCAKKGSEKLAVYARMYFQLHL